MTHVAGRRPWLPLLVLLLLCGLPSRGFALAEINDVSKERAKELGIAVTSKTRPEDVWVTVEFKVAGAMKEFRWADLELSQSGKRLVLAALAPQKIAPDGVRLQFYVDPAMLSNATVTIFVYNEPMSGIGYRLKMKEFLTRSAAR